jgi:hypothetical protein
LPEIAACERAWSTRAFAALNCVLLHVEGRSADEFLREQVRMAIELRFREREVAFGRGELRVRGLRGELRVFRIEPREHLAARHAGAGVDRARDDLAAHAKAHVRFVARAHLARIDVAARPRRRASRAGS